MLIAIDTSTRYAGVLLWSQGRVVASCSWHSTRNHTSELMPAVQRLLHQANLQATDLTGVALALGPGGFSALRVGMSVAKGLCLALNLPVTGLSTLEMEAYPYADVGRLLCPLMDAGRGEVAWAQFQRQEGQWRKTRPEAVIDLDQLVRVAPREAIFCGEGVVAHSAYLKETLEQGATVVEYPGPALRLWSLARLGAERQKKGITDDPEALQPLYLRRPSITKPRPPSVVKP